MLINLHPHERHFIIFSCFFMQAESSIDISLSREAAALPTDRDTSVEPPNTPMINRCRIVNQILQDTDTFQRESKHCIDSGTSQAYD